MRSKSRAVARVQVHIQCALVCIPVHAALRTEVCNQQSCLFFFVFKFPPVIQEEEKEAENTKAQDVDKADQE